MGQTASTKTVTANITLNGEKSEHEDEEQDQTVWPHHSFPALHPELWGEIMASRLERKKCNCLSFQST